MEIAVDSTIYRCRPKQVSGAENREQLGHYFVFMMARATRSVTSNDLAGERRDFYSVTAIFFCLLLWDDK